MKSKALIWTWLLAALLAILLASCSTDTKEPAPSPAPDASVTDTTAAASEPQTNGELFAFVMDQWKAGDTGELYAYLSDEIASLLDKDAVARMLRDMTDAFGEITSVGTPEIAASDGMELYSFTVRLKNADVSMQLSLKDARIYGISQDVRFTSAFDVQQEHATEHYFLLNGLNAVYTCATDEKAPAVLLISGSGPCDYNETVGMLTPMKDIAQSLAERGISSLRLEKRTLRFAEAFKATDGLEQEYFEDCRAALAYLKGLETIDGIYLLGHSLGGQIVAALAAQDDSVDGMILLMSSARSLADIACDQFTAMYPDRAAEFAQYRDAAKAQTHETAQGTAYYFGASDAYWASYRTIDTVQNIRAAAIPTKIINSTYDTQSFPADIRLWQDAFDGDSTVSLTVFEDLSHFGYKIDVNAPAQLYQPVELPVELADSIAEIIQ